MSSKNKEIIERIYKEYCKSNKKFYLDFLSDDASWKIVGMPEIKGKINFLKMMGNLDLKNFPASCVKNIITEDEYVVVESVGRNVSISEEIINQAYCDIYHFKNEKIKKLTTYIIDTT